MGDEEPSDTALAQMAAEIAASGALAENSAPKPTSVAIPRLARSAKPSTPSCA